MPPKKTTSKKQADAGELRRQAEETLSERKKKNALPPTTEADTQRLVHELQVHQIEVEMQNEELAQSRVEVETLLEQYTDLYDFAPMGYFTLARGSEIRQVNLAGASLLKVERGGLLGRYFKSFVAAQSQITFKAFLNRTFSSEHKEACEVTLQKDGSEPLVVYIEATREAGQGEVCRVVAVDITQRTLAEEKLRYLITHDALTGLYNRRFFMEEMAGLKHGGDFPISILVVDGDQLRDTNEVYGYATGDALLKRVAEALTSTFRTHDIAARLGGEVFGVLMFGTSRAEADVLLERFQQVIQKSNVVHFEIPIHLSLRVSTAETAAALAAILRETEKNMYRAKRGNHATEEDSLQKTI
jgi:diguanylate cyclase (GGDEF)-like protein/PAS domain S-box-containing protein